MIVRITGKCQFDGCDKPATAIACGRNQKPKKYCDAHAEVVSDEGSPEYSETFPNCGCQFGVN